MSGAPHCQKSGAQSYADTAVLLLDIRRSSGITFIKYYLMRENGDYPLIWLAYGCTEYRML
jgi:hypothetical protein